MKKKNDRGETRDIFRATIAEPITIKGKGIHSDKRAKLKIFPASSRTGLIFLPGKGQKDNIPVSPGNVSETSQAITLSNGNWSVSTVEHLLCALAVAGVTDAYFEIDSIEVPVLDGSALPFYEALMVAGIRHHNEIIEPITLTTPLWVVHEESYIIALPADDFRVSYSISFDHHLLNGKTIYMDLTHENCVRDIIPARTFGFLKNLKALNSRGFARGASLENAVVLTDSGYLNETLRFPDECIRHKVLDLIGDIYILGRPLKAHIIASRAGHTLDIALARNIEAAISGDELGHKRQIDDSNLRTHTSTQN